MSPCTLVGAVLTILVCTSSNRVHLALRNIFLASSVLKRKNTKTDYFAVSCGIVVVDDDANDDEDVTDKTEGDDGAGDADADVVVITMTMMMMMIISLLF
jgi:hypothetical protein